MRIRTQYKRELQDLINTCNINIQLLDENPKVKKHFTIEEKRNFIRCLIKNSKYIVASQGNYGRTRHFYITSYLYKHKEGEIYYSLFKKTPTANLLQLSINFEETPRCFFKAAIENTDNYYDPKYDRVLFFIDKTQALKCALIYG